MKVLFLDIDGVLNNDIYKDQNLPYPLSEFDPACVRCVNKIIEETGCEVVLSSDWRFTPEVNTILRKAGLAKDLYGATPYLLGVARGYEIQRYLNEHPEISNYAILDDIDQMLYVQRPHFAKTDCYFGITVEETEKVIRILSDETLDSKR